MMMTKEKTNIIWNIFRSARLTILLIILLAVTSIFGTVLPQREQALEFAENLSPAVLKIVNFFHLFDMYHSIWFRTLIFLLAINLLVCSIDRLPGTLRRFRFTPKPDRSKPFRYPSSANNIIFSDNTEIVKQNIITLLNNRYNRIESKHGEDTDFFYAEKGKYSFFGVYLVHISVLFILIGAIIGSILGFEAHVSIPVGESVESVIRRDTTGHHHIDLGFSVRCEDFFIDFYDNGTPKEYRSELSFHSEGITSQKRSLLVNHPVKFNGITFYQSSYGTVPGKRVRLRISSEDKPGMSETIEVEKGKIIPLGHKGDLFQVFEIETNLRGMMGPAALISVKSADDSVLNFWVFQNIEILKKRFPEEMFRSPRLNPSAFKPYSFFLEQAETNYYTGLQVNKDPGVIFVYIGFFMIMAGLIVTFFSSYKQIWIRIRTGKKDETLVDIAWKSSRNPAGMEREIAEMVNILRSTGIKG
ncbi:MAG: cytochrome c biogenesis protein ResB [Deltaproteobacteria bacterium]|nr:cytochrome c biogenesis protein ResB [Deltaproteobacteria bacterium]